MNHQKKTITHSSSIYENYSTSGWDSLSPNNPLRKDLHSLAKQKPWINDFMSKISFFYPDIDNKTLKISILNFDLSSSEIAGIMEDILKTYRKYDGGTLEKIELSLIKSILVTKFEQKETE